MLYTKTMLSFYNNQSIKSSLIKRMDDHIAMDELMQGKIGEGGKGCTVWCALNNGDIQYGYTHSSFPEVLGLPQWLAYLQDTIFEGLNKEDAKWFSSQWVRVIPVGKNLDPVKWKFCAFILQEKIEMVSALEISEYIKNKLIDAVNGCLALHTSAIETGQWNESAAKNAMKVAREAEDTAEDLAPYETKYWTAQWVARLAIVSATQLWADSLVASLVTEIATSIVRDFEMEDVKRLAYKRYADELLRLLAEA